MAYDAKRLEAKLMEAKDASAHVEEDGTRQTLHQILNALEEAIDRTTTLACIAETIEYALVGEPQQGVPKDSAPELPPGSPIQPRLESLVIQLHRRINRSMSAINGIAEAIGGE